jgi:hypothetical protein
MKIAFPLAGMAIVSCVLLASSSAQLHPVPTAVHASTHHSKTDEKPTQLLATEHTQVQVQVQDGSLPPSLHHDPVLQPTPASERKSEEKRDCLKLLKNGKVTPGTSFGSLNDEEIAKWLSMQCDQYLCKPHPLAGKGIYTCELLPDAAAA